MKKLLNKPAVIGKVAFWGANLLTGTLQIKIAAHAHYCQDKPYLFAFWHGKQLLPILQLVNHRTPKAALVSPSRDGDLLQFWLQKLNYDIVRGSSRDGNVRSLVKMVDKLRNGFSVGFGIDGPIGPIYQVKPGIIYLAQKCNVPIVPLGSAFAKKWVCHKAWDRYQIPKPFARVGYYIGKPIVIDANADIKQASIKLGYLLHRTEYQAATLLFD